MGEEQRDVKKDAEKAPAGLEVEGKAVSLAKEQITQKVIDIVVEQLDVSPDQVAMETRFVDDLGADSLDQAEIVMEFEDEFGLDIPEDEEAVRTVGDAVKYIVAQLAAKEAKQGDS